MPDTTPKPPRRRKPTRPTHYVGGNEVRLLQGGDELFPAMCQAMAEARQEVWLATYIFQDDRSGQMVAEALCTAAARGVAVRVVVDGFGTKSNMEAVRNRLQQAGLEFMIYRPMSSWWSWLQPSQLRRLHQKLCIVDQTVAFVGGINIIDDRFDQTHGWVDAPRLDFAVELRGPVASHVTHTARALWTRAQLGAQLGTQLAREVQAMAKGRPLRQAMDLLQELRLQGDEPSGHRHPQPVAAAFLVRDNVRQRRAIERAYIHAIEHARVQVEIICPYFYPGRAFKAALHGAASRGVTVRLLLQGKPDYRFAALAARVLYDELLARGIRIFEYTPAFLHAKVAVADDDWATVGSSNIDPISLLLNLEANAVIRDRAFAAELRSRFDDAAAASVEIKATPVPAGIRRWLSRGVVAWAANLYLRFAGITGRY